MGTLISCFSQKKHITLNYVYHIGAYAFSHNKFIKSLEISGTTFSIGESAFEYCNNLEAIVLPTYEYISGLKSIGDYAFSGCKKLEYMIIPKTVINIGKDIFEN